MVSAATTNVTESKGDAAPADHGEQGRPEQRRHQAPVSCRPSRHPLSRCRRSSGSISANSAFSAGSLATSWMPYQTITAKMSQA